MVYRTTKLSFCVQFRCIFLNAQYFPVRNYLSGNCAYYTKFNTKFDLCAEILPASRKNLTNMYLCGKMKMYAICVEGESSAARLRYYEYGEVNLCPILFLPSR